MKSMEDEEIQSNALEFARKNRKRIAKEFTDLSKYLPDDIPVSVFMAGSPGAGKTEFSKNIIASFEEGNNHPVIRIDGDEIRNLLPGYTGSNSFLFQGAVSLIVEKIHDLALSQKQSFVLDGTFSKPEKATDNIRRSLNKDRKPFIFYVYQNPILAWNFTQKREEAEGRNIPKESFIEQFFGAKDTVNVIRQKFGEEIVIFLVKKDFENKIVEKLIQIKPGDMSIDEYIKEQYTKEELGKIL